MSALVEPDELLAPREVAERLAVHPSTVARWVQRGVLPAWRVGGVIRIRWADVIQVAESGTSARPEQEKRHG